MKSAGIVAGVVLLMVSMVANAETESVFFPAELMRGVRENAQKDAWAGSMRQKAVQLAEPWKEMSDEQLWGLMFGATLPRSWHVYSNGTCPACGKPVPMYDWKIDALKEPWKLRCPHCGTAFPTNDFAKFYDSGLDAHGIFDPSKANQQLLYNTDHPNANDPLHTFGVDDGTGYVRGNERWRFIPYYLVFGQWKAVVQRGILALSSAYLLTDDPVYAHKAAILLNRVADVYPDFDFMKQGLLYETAHGNGYVSVWHDATIETRELAIAYDAIKPAIAKDEELAKFLGEKSAKYQTPIPIHSNADIATNIETRILKDALAHPEKIYSNYPQQYLTEAVLRTVLDWPANREQVFALLDPVIEKTTAVDGVTGEKGLAGYSAYVIQRLAEFLSYYIRADKTFLPEMVRRHPKLPQAWRFFIDTWCDNEQYYPLIGDTDFFADRVDHYAGVTFREDNGLEAKDHSAGVLAPSMYSFLWEMYEQTKDPAFAQVIYHQNGNKVDGLPYDLFCTNPDGVRGELKSIIDSHGAEIQIGDVNKQQWHLAILRSGKGNQNRAVWLDYDAGLACDLYGGAGGHSHQDCMNLGMFAQGLDLMPDFGYPPVQYGGWESERVKWYHSTASHNTVLVNGVDQTDGAGKTTLWADGEGFSAITASAPNVYPNVTKKYERTVAMVDISPKDFYVVDVFRVIGGHEHDKFFLSHFGQIETSLPMEAATDYSHPEMRGFKVARHPEPGWSVTWKVEDRYKYLPAGSDVRVRYLDFTNGIDAYTCQAWVVAGSDNTNEETWVPRVMVRHRDVNGGAEGIETNYVSLIEPFDGKMGAGIQAARRMSLKCGDKDAGDSSVAMRVNLIDGTRDLIISNASGVAVVQPEEKIETDAKLAMVRWNASGAVEMISFCGGTKLDEEGVKLRTAPGVFVQVGVGPDGVKLIRGDSKDISLLETGGKAWMKK